MKKHYLAAFDLLPLLRLFCKTHPALLMVGCLLAMLTALAGMALLGLSGWFISATALAGLTLVTAQAFDVFMPSSGIRLFTLLRTFARYGERLVTHDATLTILADLRVRLFRGLAMSEAALSLARRPARLLFRLTGDIDALDSLYLRLLTPMGSAFCAILAASLTLGWMQPELGLAVLLSTSLSTLVILDRTWTSAVFPARQRARAIEALRSDAADLVAGQSELLLADRLKAQCDRIAHVDARLAKYDDRLHWVDTRAALSFAVLGHALLAGTLATVGWLVNDGTIGVPVAVLAILVALSLNEPLSGLRRGALEMGRTTLAARRLTPHLNDPGDRRPHSEPPAENTTTAIHLQGVSARHPDSDSACILGIDLHVQRGERIALVGSSGTGKSSLMAMITGELPILAGQIRSVRYGWLTQRTELFQDSLRDNLRLACPAAEDVRLWRALETAGLADDVRSWPDGLDTWLGESGQGLSGGQARRLALARLLLRKAPLWLLDEPTEGLDASTARDVLARLDRHGHKHTWLLATHLRREAQLAERLILMHQGQIEADHRRGTEGYVALLNSLRID